MAVSERYVGDPRFRIVDGVCPHDCPDSCAWQVATEVETGKAVDLWGHPQHPVTRGRLCGKVDRYLDRTYHEGRLTTPLRRVGAKGEGKFEPIGWDEAIELIATEVRGVIDTHGAESVLPYSYAGTMGALQGDGVAEAFFHGLGASRLARTICSEAGFEGLLYTLGKALGTDTVDFAHAELIVLWGTNTLTSNMHLWPFVLEAKKKGAKVIAIDPAKTRTARAADQWIPIRPGTDGALALGLMHVLVREDLIDHDYVARATVGFDALAARVSDWTPDRVEAVTGVPAADVEALAVAYGRTKASAIRINYGVQRHRGGGMAVRNAACLPALTGAWTVRGGGIQLSTSGAFDLDMSPLRRPDLLEGRSPRTFNMNRLGDALSHDPTALARAHYHPRPVDKVPSPEDAGPPVHALFVYNCNPAAVAPDQAAVRAGLAREDLFTVVLEHFQTDTADYADLLLPATTQLEHWDLQKPYGHLYVALNRPAIDPVGESVSNAEAFRRMARALGMEDSVFRLGDEASLRLLVEAQKAPQLADLTWSNLEATGFVRVAVPDPYLPFANGEFPTPTGKCELYSARMEADGYDPLPAYTPPDVAPVEGEAPPAGTLACISPPAHSFLNSSFANVPRFLKREGEPVVQMHPADAAEHGLAEGQEVELSNERGSVILRARVTEDIMPGTVLAPGVWWAKLSPDGRNVNWLTDQGEADMGAGALFYDVRVRVRPA